MVDQSLSLPDISIIFIIIITHDADKFPPLGVFGISTTINRFITDQIYDVWCTITSVHFIYCIFRSKSTKKYLKKYAFMRQRYPGERDNYFIQNFLLINTHLSGSYNINSINLILYRRTENIRIFFVHENCSYI